MIPFLSVKQALNFNSVVPGFYDFFPPVLRGRKVYHFIVNAKIFKVNHICCEMFL